MGKRKKFDEGFKAEAVRLVGQSGKSVAQIARELGVHVNTLHGWLRELPAKTSGGAVRSHRNPDQEEIRRLERELKRVTEERDILKKATAFFANHKG